MNKTGKLVIVMLYDKRYYRVLYKSCRSRGSERLSLAVKRRLYKGVDI